MHPKASELAIDSISSRILDDLGYNGTGIMAVDLLRSCTGSRSYPGVVWEFVFSVYRKEDLKVIAFCKITSTRRDIRAALGDFTKATN